VNFYQFHIGDYLSATRHLSWEEDAAYRRLLDTYYTTEKPLPADLRACCRLVMAQTDSQREAVRIVLSEFFTETPDGWINKRADAEISEMKRRQDVARDKANKRWHPPAKTPSNAAAYEPDAAALETDAAPLLPVPVPVPIEEKEIAVPRQSAAPPTPPPPFDGTNAGALNGRHVVAIAPHWELPADWGEDAEALGFVPSEVMREAEKFRQYWAKGKGAGKRRNVKGWRQSWSNWLAKAAENRR
jgi:uncharacterized protein YdaU (DUF1376 family)